ncbi:hypothetical protein HYDPIDRAFT_33117 [Hydnomerulius pinastri MD-312]|uniref:Uncharacterized protein n=1 Tax=Hydnomerulius pinastri MD-312 TaxID=994086 RepID=A0A0C9W9G2_9AGAM|nr:hypothetical protein HYDPIDRAFT_33117 [Hydnomerulius pinastri MD-312]
MNLYPTNSYPAPDNGVDSETMTTLFFQHFPELASGQLSFTPPTRNTPYPPTSSFQFPPFDPTSYPALHVGYPPPTNGAEGDMFAQTLTRHFQFNFAGLQDQENPSSATFQGQDPPAPTLGSDGVPEGTSSDSFTAANPTQQHAEAVSFIRARGITLISRLEEAGADRWVSLCSHLALLAWRNLAFDQFQPRSAEYWEVQLTRVYSEYVWSGKDLENGKRFISSLYILLIIPYISTVNITITQTGKIPQLIATNIDVSTFTNEIIRTLRSDVQRQFISRIGYSSRVIVEDHTPISTDSSFRDRARSWLNWKGTNEGFPYFHEYEPLPGIAKRKVIYFENTHATTFLRAALTINSTSQFFGIYEEVSDAQGYSYFRPYHNSNTALFEFCSASVLTSVEFILNQPNRKANSKWRSESTFRSQLIQSFFRRVLSWQAPASEERLVDAHEIFFESANCTLE